MKNYYDYYKKYIIQKSNYKYNKIFKLLFFYFLAIFYNIKKEN